MYEDLIRRIRICVAQGTSIGLNAAEAIEELTALSLRQERQLVELTEQASRAPHWASVEEQPPEEFEDVLCYYEYFRYGDYNCMFRTIDRGYYGCGRWGGEAGQGYKNRVLSWMPLLAPPKEADP